MTALAHATLQRLKRGSGGGKDQPPPLVGDGDPVPVQFNPSTLRISRNNDVDKGGTTTRSQKRQHPAQEGSTLTFDLEFDTAEQRSGGQYVDVRRWTALVRQFVEPPPDRTGDPPPAVRLVWGTLRFDGIVTQVSEELDLFAPDGTPLRAKAGVTIVEQNPRYEAHVEGPGVLDTRAATEPGAPRPGAAPGTAGTNRPRQVVAAQDGESAQQMLSRLGLDPAAWRAAMNGLESPLTLAAGSSVELGAEVSAGLGATAGLRLSAGFAGGVSATSVGGLTAALGVGPAGPDGPLDAQTAGFVLSAGGGIGAAADAVLGAQTDEATARARESFDVPREVRGAGSGGSGGPYPGGGPPGGGLDRRAAGYGRGIPLRARADAGTLAETAAGGGRSLADRARREEIPAPDPGAAPWERLPPDPPGRSAADCAQRHRDAGAKTLRWTPRGGPV
ncbi:CIS tube protein [Streptomyces phaeofaciens]|uniref:CIS tube protein n=1 Tax=Streptomyces phaeofaciens TaxID=68254 RepID=UPI0036883EEA